MIAKYHKLGGFYKRNLFFKVSEAGKSKIRVSDLVHRGYLLSVTPHGPSLPQALVPFLMT